MNAIILSRHGSVNTRLAGGDLDGDLKCIVLCTGVNREERIALVTRSDGSF